MTILYRYIIKEFIKPLTLSAVAFGGLVLISEFFRELNYYIEHKASFLIVFEYLLLNLPWWIIQVLPVSVLLAVLFSLGGLARTGEITALKAAGVNLWHIIFIFLFAGFGISAIDLTVRETLIPATITMAEDVREHRIHKRVRKPRKTVFDDLMVSVPDNGRMTIGTLNIETPALSNIVIDYFNDDFTLKKQVVAPSSVWQDNHWHIQSGVERTFNLDGSCTEKPFTEYILQAPFTPDDFTPLNQRPEHITTQQLKHHISRMHALGISAEKERMQFHSRFASATSHLVVMLIGIPFALGLGSRHGKMISFTFALIFAFIYWSVQAIGQSLGENNILPAPIAAWLGNMAFAIGGLIMISGIRK